jgi:hypothetical protein
VSAQYENKVTTTATRPLAVLLCYVLAASTIPKDEIIPAEGVVVAIQRAKTDTRVVDPPSFADLAEIYIVRVDHWLQPRSEKYIILEYIHHANLISYEKFDKTIWKFQIHQASPQETKDCFSWMARGPTFLPTAFGANAKLPDPKTLPCFIMTMNPVPISPAPAVAGGGKPGDRRDVF